MFKISLLQGVILPIGVALMFVAIPENIDIVIRILMFLSGVFIIASVLIYNLISKTSHIVIEGQISLYEENIVKTELTLKNNNDYSAIIDNISVIKPKHCEVCEAVTYNRASGDYVIPQTFAESFNPGLNISSDEKADLIFFIKTPDSKIPSYTIKIILTFKGKTIKLTKKITTPT